MQFFVALLVFLVASEARTIQWTAAGGNPLWNNAGNWDCGCLPTADDDVVIDLQAIPGNVQIGGIVQAVVCKSLTVGGTSKFRQTLTISGALTVGAGGGALNANGVILLQSSPSSPFLNQGTFTSRGGGFSFETGVLGGSGSFSFPSGTVLNFTTAAAKGISTSVNVGGTAVSTADGTPIQLTNGGKLSVDGTFRSSGSLVLSSDSTSSFSVGKGQFIFTGASLSIQGSANIGSWSLGPSSTVVVLSNMLTSGALSMASGAVLRLIGAPSDNRKFDSITSPISGTATLSVEGGTNTFNTLSVGSFTATGGSASVGSGAVGKLVIGGSTLTGSSLQAVSGLATTGTISGGLAVAVDSLVLGGVINVNGDGTTLSIIQSGKFTQASQLTLTAGSTFVVGSSASVDQSKDFKLVQGPPAKTAPVIQIDGSWTSSANLAIFGIPVVGHGSFYVTPTGFWALTNVNLAASLIDSAGSLFVTQGSLNFGTFKGPGSFSGSPSNLTIASINSTGSLTLSSGSVTVTSGSLGQLTVGGGNFNVAKSLNIGTFNFNAGVVSGPSSQAQITATSTVVSQQGMAATLTNVQLTTSAFSLKCPVSCQFFTANSAIKTA